MRWHVAVLLGATVAGIVGSGCERGTPTDEPFFGEDRPTDRPTDAPDSGTTATGDTGTTPTGPTLRVVAWNVEGLGTEGSADWLAVRDVLGRLDGDVVGLSEVFPEESAALTALAGALGYGEVRLGIGTPFGDMRNAVLSRISGSVTRSHASRVLSGDAAAEDVTRAPVSAVVDAPWGGTLAIAVQHGKAGFDDVDEFRRLIDVRRTAQAAEDGAAGDRVVMGDINEDPREVADAPRSPITFTRLPGGLPASFRLGEDLEPELSSGLTNDPFRVLADRGLLPIEATQRDGRVATRDSGRWIDHVLISSGLRAVGSEIYDSTDEGQPGGVPKAGDALPRPTVRNASDHLPVVVDLTRG